MGADFLMIVGCGVLGLLAHVATKKRWVEWLLRIIIGLTCAGEGLFVASPPPLQEPWSLQVTGIASGFSGVDLLRQFRLLLSHILTGAELLFSKRAWQAVLKKSSSLKQVFLEERTFMPASIPHMVALFIYVQTMAQLLGVMNASDFSFPAIPLPMPVQIEQLISYNGLGLVLLSFLGVGVFVARPFKEAARRLGLVKPTARQVAIGLALIVFGFLNDYLWSLYTHQSQLLPNLLTSYNSGTFTAGGGAMSALVLALATALCAGIGEETLFRGAVQPAFGILPSAIMHGVLHAQFAHAPALIMVVTTWSIVMGIVRRYTNTTTTIIGHAGFNFLVTFLIAFNP